MIWRMVLGNLLRRPGRSVLTIIGIGIGTAAVVSLVGISNGFEKSWEAVYAARGTDLIVSSRLDQIPLPAPFNEDTAREVAAIPGVRDVATVLNQLMEVDQGRLMLVYGWEPNGFLWQHIELRKGEWIHRGAQGTVLLGTAASEVLKKQLGDLLLIGGKEFVVVGIFESPAFIENASIVTTMQQLQALTQNAGKVNFLNVRFEENATDDAISNIRSHLQRKHPELRTYSVSEVSQGNRAMQLAHGMSWSTSAIALVVGTIGMLNTIMMNTLERTREIGILLAVGWTRFRVLYLILIESVVMSILGALSGIVAGRFAVAFLEQSEMGYGRIDAHITPLLVMATIAISIVLGLLGGAFPAYKASRMTPVEALRYW